MTLLTPPKSFVDIDGVRRYEDQTTSVVNTRNGIRVTTDQPKNPARAVFLVGHCTTFGVGADDAHTISSCLQRLLNEKAPAQKFIVYNYGYFNSWRVEVFEIMSVLNSLPLKCDDIVLLNVNCNIDGVPFCDLGEKSVRPHDYGEIIYSIKHFTKNGNRMTADGIFDFLAAHDFFAATPNASDEDFAAETDADAFDDADENEQLRKYKRHLKKIYAEKIRQKIGAIVMNCNPFTLGHRYLVEEALKKCDRLIVFVVEEDKSVFPFADRFALVKDNLADLQNVFVLPSGEFIISSRTFTEYFNKESLQDRKIDTTLDVTLFAKEIAPCLGITMRFAGEEPFDTVTRQYNDDMRRLLPQYGIAFVEIPRLKQNGVEISASAVRSLAEKKDFAALKKLVPPKTLKYLKNKFL